MGSISHKGIAYYQGPIAHQGMSREVLRMGKDKDLDNALLVGEITEVPEWKDIIILGH